MTTASFRFQLAISDAAKTPLGQFPIEPPDLVPAEQHLALVELRAAGVPLNAPALIEPRWSAEGEPHLASLLVTRGTRSLELGWEHFRPSALEISARLVAEGKLKDGDLFHYRPLAFRQPPAPQRSRIAGVEDDDPLAAACARQFDDLFERSSEHDAQFADAEDFPVFIPASVLDEFAAQTRAAGALETGGILIGRLWRDPARCEIAVEVTALIAARHTEAKSVSLKFTPATWSAVRDAIALRNSSEVPVSWIHSHPVWSWDYCKDCPPEKRAVCSLRRPFLSSDDRSLHRVVFPAAFSVAFLASFDSEIEWACFGWRRGVVQRRAFHLLEPST
jgi:hypothetical protein